MAFEPKALLEKAKEGTILEERVLKHLCDFVKDILVEESNVVPVSTPTLVVGDVHGQFHDVLELFRVSGWPPEKNFLFLGDYVDRGANSLETFVLLLVLKACYPDRVTLLRGNHESRQITTVYGFYDEIVRKYGTASSWRSMCEVFDLLPLAALVDGKTLGVHGGLSPEIATIDAIRAIPRQAELPNEGKFCDLMWSDPTEITPTWLLNERGAGWLFGHKVAAHFNQLNGLDLLCRAHQLVMAGYEYHFSEKSVVTVWSAPNYCYRCGNKAVVMSLDAQNKPDFIFFDEVSSQHGITERLKPKENLYFL